MKHKVGEYYYNITGNYFRIYRYTSVTDSVTTGSPVYTEPYCYTRDEARKRVYQLNGWRLPK